MTLDGRSVPATQTALAELALVVGLDGIAKEHPEMVRDASHRRRTRAWAEDQGAEQEGHDGKPR